MKFLSIMLIGILSFVNGGFAMAVDVAGGTGSERDVDPNTGNPLEGATKDSIGAGIDLQGKGATGSAVEEAELDDSQIDEYIMKHEAWKYPLHTDFLGMATKTVVDTKTPKHPIVGEAILEAITKSATASADQAHTAELKVYGADMKLFQEKSTIRCIGVRGYDEKGVQNNTNLTLVVIANERNTKVTVAAINGPLSSTGETYVPSIPGGTKLRVMAPALEESALVVAPDNILPGWKEMYLQRKACAITKTDFYERMKKLFKNGGQMVKDNVLSTYRRKCTSTILFGVKGKDTVYNDQTKSEENRYFQEGVVYQIPNQYQLAAMPTVNDLIAISRLTFTKWARTNVAQAYCDDLFMEWLGRMDFTSHPEIKFDCKRDALGVKVGTFETNFGTLEFKLDYALSENGMEGTCIIFPMKEAVRYIYEEKTVQHDHKNDTEARDAKSEYYITDDCLALTGLNAMIVGQNLSNIGSTSDLGNKYIPVTSLSSITSPDANAVYYLTQADGQYAAGAYKRVGTAWQQWIGTIVA